MKRKNGQFLSFSLVREEHRRYNLAYYKQAYGDKDKENNPMQIRFLRHATFVVTLNGLTLLVDPMLSPAQTMEPIAHTGNQQRNPMVDLPLSEGELYALLEQIDAVLVTHTHPDHWDAIAQALLPRHLSIVCQPDDQNLIEQAGFSHVLPVHQHREWQGLRLSRIGGQHGTGTLGKKMGPVSGFVLSSTNSPSLYIAGDTIWCPEVEQALKDFSPEVVVLNTGAATFLTGEPITMTDDDVCQICQAAPQARLIAVHMDTMSHCRLTRADLERRLKAAGVEKQVLIPNDGEIIHI